MSGQIIDATIVAAPKRRNTDGEKRDIKEGRIPAQWADKPARLRQKDRDARWTVKYTKAKPDADGMPRAGCSIAISTARRTRKCRAGRQHPASDRSDDDRPARATK